MRWMKKGFFLKSSGVLLAVALFVIPQISRATTEPVNPEIHLGTTGLYVRLIEMDLNGLGSNFTNFGSGNTFNVALQQAVGNFQDKFKIPRDGKVDPATWQVMTNHVAAVQRRLNALGYPTGKPDGQFGETTIKALKWFQKDHGLSPEGIVNPRTRQQLFNPNPKDHFEDLPTSTSLNSLNPRVAILARKFLALAKANHMDIRIIAAFRSWDDEDKFYAQGRTAPGNIITDVRGGASFHNWGLAFDAAPFEHGVMSKDMAKFRKMGELGVRVGLEWGGNFKDIKDMPHFQYTFGLNTEDLLDGVRPPR